MTIKYHLLVRFMSERRFAEDFMNGLLFMNYLGYYWDEFRTDRPDVEDQGDFLEGTYCYGDPVKMGFDKKWCDILATDLIMRAKGYKYCDVACFTRVDYETVRVPAGRAVHFGLDERMERFGDYAVIITDQTEFLRRIDIAMKREGFFYLCGDVAYHRLKKNNTDAEFGHHVVLKAEQEIDMSDGWFAKADGSNYDSFDKTIKYDYQREWRITAYRGVKETKGYKLNLGRSLKDIACVVDSRNLGRELEKAFLRNKIKHSWNGNWPGNIGRGEIREKFYELGDHKAEPFVVIG